MKKITLLLVCFTFCLFNGFAQYGCGSAVTLTNGFSQNNITSPGNGGAADWNQNPIGTTISPNYWDDDVYLFQYTAGAVDETITMTIFSRSSWNGIGIFSACDGTTFSGQLAAQGFTGANTTKTVSTNVASGATVYIAVGQWGTPNNLDFDVVSFNATPILGIPNCNAVLTSPANNTMTAPLNGLLSWTAATGNPSGYKLSLGTTPSGTNILNAVNVGNVLSFSAGALLPETTYYLKIVATNSNGNASGCTEFSFTTCASVTNFFENFDTPATIIGNLPSCWSRAGNGQTNVIMLSNVAPNASAYRLYMFGNATWTTPLQSFAIMPSVSNLQANTHRLKFKAYTASGTNRILQIGYFTDLSDINSFQTLQTILLPGTTIANSQEFSITPSAIPAGVTNLVFRNNAPLGPTAVYIDDVAWEPSPSCPDIMLVQTQVFNSTSATVSWQPGGSETTWEYAIGLASLTNPAALTPVAVATSPMVTLTGLTPNTAYKIWIRSSCAAGIMGNWPQNPLTFTTTCAPVTSFTENFDSYTLIGSNNPMPLCWSRFGSTGNTAIATGSAAAFSPPNRLLMNPNSPLVGMSYAVMPPVSNLQAQTHRLKFKAYSSSAVNALEIGYFAQNNDANSFVILQSLQIPTTTQAAAAELFYTPNADLAGIESLVFRVNGFNFQHAAIYIDDVAWEALPVCFDIGAVSFTDNTTNSVAASWTPGGTETAWEYVFALNTVTTPNGLTPIAVTNTPTASLSGLQPNSIYNFWIRSNCGNGLLGNWSSAQTFSTGCAAVTTLPWTEGFEGVTNVGINGFPPCWLKQNGDWSTATASTFNTPKTGTKYIRNSWSATNEFMWTPGFELVAGTSYDFSFNMQGDGYAGWNIDVFQNTQQNSTNAQQLGTTATPPGAAVNGTQPIQAYQMVSRTFVPTSSGVYYFAIRVNQTNFQPWYVAFDDFKLELTPSCVIPTLEPVTNLSNASATINWLSSSAAANGFDYIITSDTAFVPNAETPATGTASSNTTSANLTGLNTSTLYRYFVRALCSTSDVSSWSAVGTFTTSCVAVSSFPWTEGFENIAPIGLNAFPTCWIRQNGDWSTSLVSVYNTPNTGTAYLRNAASSTNELMWTPGFELVAGINYQFSFFMQGDGWNGWNVDVLQNTAQNSITALLIGTTATASGIGATALQGYQKVNTTFMPTANGIYYFAIRVNQPAWQPWYIAFDDFSFDVAPNCTAPTLAPAIDIAATTATLNWNSVAASVGGYEYFIATDASIIPNATTVPAGFTIESTTAVVSNLASSTTYRFYVRSVCSATEKSDWSSTGIFTTPCAPISNLPWTEGFEQIPFAGNTAFPPCWFEQNGDWSTATANNFNTPRTGTKYIRNSWSATDEFMWTPGFELIAGTGYDFSFYMQGDGYAGWDVAVFYNSIQNSATATQFGTSVTANGIGSAAIQPYTLVNNTFVPATSGTYYFAVRVNQPSSIPWYVAFDDFKVEFSTNCSIPFTLPATDITATTATLSWIASFNAPANGYDYWVTTTESTPTSSTAPSGNLAVGTTSVTLTGLDAATNYRFYVRSVCSNGSSLWSPIGTFKTLCDMENLPYTINFESETDTELPDCTEIHNVGDGNEWVTTSSSGNGFAGRVLKYNQHSISPANTWFFTNEVNLVSGVQYTISYTYGNDSATTVEKLKVAYGFSNINTAMTTQLADHPTITGGTATDNSVNFTPTASGIYTFGFNAYSAANQLGLLVDNIVVQQALSTAGFDSNSFTAYPNPVKSILNLKYIENIDTVAVYNVLGQQMLIKNSNATESQIDMSNLTAGTYLVKITSGQKVKTIKVIKE